MAQAEIYKWVDDTGVTQYSSKPPADQPAKEIILKTDKFAKKAEVSMPKAITVPKLSIRSKKADPVTTPTVGKLNVGGYSKFNFPKRIHGENYDNQNLENANFGTRKIQNTSFRQSRLKGASFKKSKLLEGLSFEDADLSGTDFSHAFLNRVDFTGADLTGAKFDGFECLFCKFDHAILTASSLRQSKFHEVSFRRAELKDAVFTMVTWSELSLIGAKHVDYQQFYREISNNPKGSGKITYDYQGCQIGVVGADCRGKDLSGHQFFAEVIQDVNFQEANLSGANFTLTRLINSNFTGANLSSATFGKHVYKVNFSHADLSAADFKATSRPDVILDGAKLKNLQFQQSQFTAAAFLNADITGCKKCQVTKKIGSIDFDELREAISSYQPAAGIVTKQDYLDRLVFQKKFRVFMAGRADFSNDQYADLLQLMLKSNHPFLIYDGVQLSRNLSQTPDRGKAVCKNPGVVTAMLPLINPSSTDIDLKVNKNRPVRSLHKTTRFKAIMCMTTNIPDRKQVNSAFKKAYKKESEQRIKMMLLVGYKDDPRQLENILIDALAKGSNTLAKLAAVHLRSTNTLSEDAIVIILKQLGTEKQAGKELYDLFKNKDIIQKLSLEQLTGIEAARKKKNWDSLYIRNLIHFYKKHAVKVS